MWVAPFLIFGLDDQVAELGQPRGRLYDLHGGMSLLHQTVNALAPAPKPRGLGALSNFGGAIAEAPPPGRLKDLSVRAPAPAVPPTSEPVELPPLSPAANG